MHIQYIPNFIVCYADYGATQDVVHTKSLSVNIMYSSSIIGEISIIYYIEPVCYFRNTLSTLIVKDVCRGHGLRR
jgi:hypothetical protein